MTKAQIRMLLNVFRNCRHLRFETKKSAWFYLRYFGSIKSIQALIRMGAVKLRESKSSGSYGRFFWVVEGEYCELIHSLSIAERVLKDLDTVKSRLDYLEKQRELF